MPGLGGRPPNWSTPEALQDEIDAYFRDTKEEEWTVTGLALALNTSRETLMDYQEKDGFSDAVKKAKLKVQSAYEKDLRKKGRSGDIFALKNFGWTDKQELDHTTKGEKIGGPSIPPQIAEKMSKVYEEEMLKLYDGKDSST